MMKRAKSNESLLKTVTKANSERKEKHTTVTLSTTLRQRFGSECEACGADKCRNRYCSMYGR